jgi:hypothetical protein
MSLSSKGLCWCTLMQEINSFEKELCMCPRCEPGGAGFSFRQTVVAPAPQQPVALYSSGRSSVCVLLRSCDMASYCEGAQAGKALQQGWSGRLHSAGEPRVMGRSDAAGQRRTSVPRLLLRDKPEHAPEVSGSEFGPSARAAEEGSARQPFRRVLGFQKASLTMRADHRACNYLQQWSLARHQGPQARSGRLRIVKGSPAASHTFSLTNMKVGVGLLMYIAACVRTGRTQSKKERQKSFCLLHFRSARDHQTKASHTSEPCKASISLTPP